VHLSARIEQIQLTLPLPPIRDNTNLTAEILRVQAGRVRVWIGGGIKPVRSGTATTAVVTIHASDLTVGDYVVYVRREVGGRLSEPIEMYAFSVERE
jgi:hypothetical protein